MCDDFNDIIDAIEYLKDKSSDAAPFRHLVTLVAGSLRVMRNELKERIAIEVQQQVRQQVRHDSISTLTVDKTYLTAKETVKLFKAAYPNLSDVNVKSLACRLSILGQLGLIKRIGKDRYDRKNVQELIEKGKVSDTIALDVFLSGSDRKRS